MKIEKTAINEKRSRVEMCYYEKAREGMHDVLQQMHSHGLVDEVLLPGYIGWSPKEGSGIFDSISSIEGIRVSYYKMTSDLKVDKMDLYSKIKTKKSLVLFVNYFGFRDLQLDEMINYLKKQSVWIMEDNAHGVYTWCENSRVLSDLVIFSLHKMFPFSSGGSLAIQNEELWQLNLCGSKFPLENANPYLYHVHELSETIKANYFLLSNELKRAEEKGILHSLKKDEEIRINTPQTYPVVLNVGNRDKVYEMMNEAGFGVVSLYHTLIEPLRTKEFDISIKLASHILNLPVHQDVDPNLYSEMVDYLISCCLETKEEKI